MDNEQKNGSLPDISGVFDIDENTIPSDRIADSASAPERPRDYAPILLTDPVTEKQNKKELRELKARKKAEKKARKRKKIRRRLVFAAAAVLFVAAAVFGIKFAVDYSRRPTGEIVRSYVSSIAKHYDTEAVLTPEVTDKGELITAALFSENDYDIYSVTKGLPAYIMLGETDNISGRVIDIKQEASDSSVMEKIRNAFPDGEYSAGVNYVVKVQTDITVSEQEDMTASVRIITAQADNAVVVPSTAVHKIGTKFYIWIYKPFTKTAVRQEVSVGIEADGLSEITGGLKTDTRVVSVFSCSDEELTDAEKIKIKEPR